MRVAVLKLIGCAAIATIASAQESVPLALLVFDRVTVVDVEHGKLLPAQRVIVAGNRIQAVGPADQICLPSGAQLVEAQGKYLIPGLWDLHTHPQRATDLFYPLFVANGVTGIRDAHSEWPLDTLMKLWREILAGTRVGPPRQLLTGRPPWVGKLTEEDIAARKAAGANFLKLYGFTFRDAAAARRVGIPFGGHVKGVSAIEASDSGIKILDHVNFAGGIDTICLGPQASVERCRPVAERLRQNGTWWVPTLIRRGGLGQPHSGPASDPVLQRFYEIADQFWSGSIPKADWLRDVVNVAVIDSLRFLSITQRVGLPILAGTDVGAPVLRTRPPGFALHGELAMYVAEGMPPLEALQTATLNPAKMLGGTDSMGAVAPGKLADLVLLDANPLADITNTTTIRAVVANGRYFDRIALDRLLAEVQRTGLPAIDRRVDTDKILRSLPRRETQPTP